MMTRFMFVLLILFFLSSCQNNKINIGLNNKKNDCSTNPSKLDKVKEINIDEIASPHSGIVKSGQDVGYKFVGQKGKILELNTESDICLWIYTPTGEKLNLEQTLELPMDGNYIIQLSKIQGATTYDLTLSLKEQKDQVEIVTTNTQKPSVKEFILNHYQKLNDRQYKQSWQELTSNFQNNQAINYSEYTNWWNKVDDIEIKKIDLIEQEKNRAIAQVNIEYKLKTGKTFYDTNNKLIIVWNSKKDIWQIDDKLASNSSREIEVLEATNIIENLYIYLSEKQFQSATKLYEDQLAFQFNKDFFAQFDRVTVDNLQVTSNNSSSIDFIGNNTYYYPDGSTQKEKRSYRVTKIQDTLKITSSEFIKVTKFRS